MAELTLDQLKERLKLYEQNGAAKLYYALNRKMNEMADMLNDNSLNDINLDDPKDKSFDRVFKLLEKSQLIATSSQTLRSFAGITDNEQEDINRKPFVDTIAESRK